MFGYVKPFKPELKICEFEAYKAVYCGLCGQLGKSFGPLARLTLSYDFTFLAMLHFAVSGEKADASPGRCFVNPLKRTLCVKESESLRFSADAAAIMLYNKLLDNVADSGFLGKAGWSLLRPLAASPRKKAAKRRPELDAVIAESMRRQAVCEAEKSPSLDAAAEPTAAAMADLCAMLSDDERQRRVLSRFGYFLGRYVYLCDALDDLIDDLKSGGYNPLLLRFEITSPRETDKILAAIDAARDSLYMTIGAAARAYDLLSPSDFRPVLDNVVALGMRGSVDGIITTVKEKCK